LAPSAGGSCRLQRLPRLHRAGPSASLDERPGEVAARAGYCASLSRPDGHCQPVGARVDARAELCYPEVQSMWSGSSSLPD
jgi:hypothetical protein